MEYKVLYDFSIEPADPLRVARAIFEHAYDIVAESYEAEVPELQQPQARDEGPLIIDAEHAQLVRLEPLNHPGERIILHHSKVRQWRGKVGITVELPTQPPKPSTRYLIAPGEVTVMNEPVPSRNPQSREVREPYTLTPDMAEDLAYRLADTVIVPFKEQ